MHASARACKWFHYLIIRTSSSRRTTHLSMNRTSARARAEALKKLISINLCLLNVWFCAAACVCVCVFFLHTLYATVWARWRWWWSCVRVLRAQSPLKIKRRVCSRASSARAASIGGFLSHSVWRRRRRRQLLLDCARRWRARHNVNIICYTHPRWLAVCQTQFEYKRFSNAELVGYLLQICEYIYI